MLLAKLIITCLIQSAVASRAHSYLISLKDSETLESFFKYDLTLTTQIKSMIDHSFSIGNFSGFSGNFTSAVIARLKKCPMVAEITPDIILKAFDVQYDSPRHLARLSQGKKLKSSQEFNYHYDSEASGAGVCAYVVDSGIELTHPDFEGRAVFGIDYTRDGSGDVNGHGTHVAGLIGSKKYGSSKNVEIIEVKALDVDGAGSLSTIISALEFIVNHRIRSGNLGVVNLSLGATKSAILNRAIAAAANTGLVVVVAAGNSNVNACTTSPASSEVSITVGAIDDLYDSIALFSNWGDCVDIFASGVYVASTNSHDFLHPQYFSGTSMAAPIISGLAANLLSDGVSPRDVKARILQLSTKDRIRRRDFIFRSGTPNRIAFGGIYTGIIDEDTDSEV